VLVDFYKHSHVFQCPWMVDSRLSRTAVLKPSAQKYFKSSSWIHYTTQHVLPANGNTLYHYTCSHSLSLHQFVLHNLFELSFVVAAGRSNQASTSSNMLSDILETALVIVSWSMSSSGLRRPRNRNVNCCQISSMCLNVVLLVPTQCCLVETDALRAGEWRRYASRLGYIGRFYRSPDEVTVLITRDNPVVEQSIHTN